MKKYIKPNTEIINIQQQQLLAASVEDVEQCSCYEFMENGGCRGCHGNCGCNHWDPETGEIIPGC